MKIFIFILFIATFPKSQQKEPRMFIYDSKFISLDSIVSNPTVEIKCKVNTRENPCNLTPKVSFTFTKEVPRPYIHFKAIDKESATKIVDQTTYLCLLSEAHGLDLLMKIIWENVLKYVDVPIKCPLPAGPHHINSFDQSTLKLAFSILPKNRPILFSVVVKVRMNKAIKDVLSYSHTLEIVDA